MVIIENVFDERQLSVQLGLGYGEDLDWDILTDDQQTYAKDYGAEKKTMLNEFTFPGVTDNAANGFKGSIFEATCGGEEILTLSDKYFDISDDGEDRVPASLIVNTALELVFDGKLFADLDCSALGVVCTDEGVMTVADTCTSYNCNPTCAPTYMGW
jgi:hypothetical protein